MGRTVKVENGFSNGTALETTNFTYDYMGNVLTETDGEGNTTSYAYNDLGQLLTVTDALSGITSYTYDLAGNVASLETPGESVTSYTYDTLGRLISETDALGKTEYYRYDANGNVTGIKDRNLNVITTAYDAVNRPVSKAGGSLNVSYSYDAFDNLTEMVDATGTTEFSYTYDNLLESITYPDEKTLFYRYAPEDNTVTKENYREEESVSHFDSLGREVAIYENEDAIAEFVYNGGIIERAIYENGSTDYSYDNAMRLTGLTSSLTGATGNIGEYSYEYDNRGNQTKKTEIKNGESLVTEYIYDALSRLSSVTEPDGSVTGYSFDDNGNISAKSITHPAAFVFTSGDISVSGITSHTVTYAYDANNRLLTETEEVEGDTEFTGTKTYTYDDAGNLIGKTTGGDYGAKTESYVYDAFSRMTEYKVGGETVASYGYNGNGERVSKTVGESLTKFYLENGNVINEGNGTAINVTNYFGATGIFKRASGETESILYKNGHGDVVRKTSGTSVIRDYDYDAYGKEKTNVADDNPFRYAGEYQDLCSGLIYLRNRYYDPSIGRFISEDPIRDGLNWYVYANNNPLKYTDPTGLSSEERLGEGIWSFKNDKFGVSILSHWLFGGGTDYVQENGVWGTYMKDNSLLKTKVQEIVFPLANDVKNNSSKTIDITTSMEIQNGEDIIGYQYLHGTNADVGGFQIKGTVSKNKKGDITYDLTYTWNDKIDPNFMYYSDSKKAEFAKSIPLANPTDYTIRITWSDKTVIKANPTWYNWNKGWLK